MYKVESITTNWGIQWVLVNEEGNMVELPCKFLKHLSATNKSSNTGRSYAYALKFFSEFLETRHVVYTDVTMRELFEFLAWLQDPLSCSNVVQLKQDNIPSRSARTVNTYMAAVMSFYRFLFSAGIISTDFDRKYLLDVGFAGTAPKYKDFLYHTHKGDHPLRSVFHVKEPRKRIPALSPDEVQRVLEAASNPRDKFLVYLLFVSGLRIGEMLSLYTEDIIYDLSSGHRIRLKDRGLLSNGGKLKTGPRDILVNQDAMDMMDDYLYWLLDIVEDPPEFLFVKISGELAGSPMDYNDIAALFRRLRRKTALHVHAHVFRHTHATIYYAQTRDAKLLQERLGHRDIQTTLNTYVHPTDKDILADWEKVSGSFSLGVR